MVEKIPIIVGVTGHRQIVENDKPAIKEKVLESLKEIQALCKAKKRGEETPMIMLNAFAEGADILCAEVAIENGIDVYAVLPTSKEEYIKSFENEIDRAKLFELLGKAKREIIAPDIEQNQSSDISTVDYQYRQLGIYVAEHSHLLLALWDGKPSKSNKGCGTSEVIRFALEHKFLDKDHLFKPGTINDSAVCWLKVRKEGEGRAENVRRTWLQSNIANRERQGEEYYLETETPPQFLKEIIAQTRAYNSENFSISDEKVILWDEVGELDAYRKTLRYHHAKADEVSYARHQSRYNRFLLAIAIIGTLVALSFLLYDSTSLPFMIFPCTVWIGLIVAITLVGKKKDYQKKYIAYRAFAEVLRIQFYLTMSIKEDESLTNVCDLYSWTQKMDMIWIYKAIQTIAVTNPYEKLNLSKDKVVDLWIGKNKKPEGQLHYHNRKMKPNQDKANLYNNLSSVFQCVTIGIYVTILLLEIVTYISKAFNVSIFWDGIFLGHVGWRNFGALILGIFTAGSLLLSSFLGKLSYDRKAEDNKKMILFYASAYERWQEVRGDEEEEEKFLKAIAREEIVENGIWCSYVNENRLEINV